MKNIVLLVLILLLLGCTDKGNKINPCTLSMDHRDLILGLKSNQLAQDVAKRFPHDYSQMISSCGKEPTKFNLWTEENVPSVITYNGYNGEVILNFYGNRLMLVSFKFNSSDTSQELSNKFLLPPDPFVKSNLICRPEGEEFNVCIFEVYDNRLIEMVKYSGYDAITGNG